jgi:hypothetical protein
MPGWTDELAVWDVLPGHLRELARALHVHGSGRLAGFVEAGQSTILVADDGEKAALGQAARAVARAMPVPHDWSKLSGL